MPEQRSFDKPAVAGYTMTFMTLAVLIVLLELLGVLLMCTAVASASSLLRSPSGWLVLACYAVGLVGAGVASYRVCRRVGSAASSTTSSHGFALLGAVVVVFLVAWLSGMILVNTFGSCGTPADAA